MVTNAAFNKKRRKSHIPAFFNNTEHYFHIFARSVITKFLPGALRPDPKTR
jgi:hypothetical protein